ncbi:hypothetical protein COCCADRAFT_9005 [Bipolaris zeicola 26-R-13]|uniref:Zn(2)-C6 fungal-type domain-containing protein n=1 Tax=Cochliobolus carbonum (strain 26-R-13) TaxID=930089 RepID=W6XTJ1_COCC2|nr:uncharacterized protein COCCADRAFT_9005 [Bipolaris zeicola 26-R-13]EUC28655.1 hypothetical protein COCCADRAFT_9005 [Bipolaris zeicola 26-R-13]
MGKAFTFIVDHTARADLASKRKLRRRRGACGNCKRRKVACNGSMPCQHCHKASITCQYAESNRSTRNTAPITEADTTILQTITPGVSTSSSPQDLENTDFFSDNFTNVLTPDFYCDDLVHVSVSDDPMDLFHWNQLGEAFGGPIPGPIPGPSPRCEQLETARNYADTSSTGLDSDYYSQDDTQYCYTMNDMSRDQTLSNSTTITEESPHRDHVRSSLHSWLLTSMRNLNGEKNNHVIEASQKLLAANSPMTEYCSAREMDIMAALTDVRSERSFNQEFFHNRINACFAELYEGSICLDSESAEKLVDQIISNPFVSSPTSIALVFSLLAIGSRRLDLSHGNGILKGATIGYFRIALRMRPSLYDEASLLKSQTLLLMTYFSHTIGASSTSSLMADATSCLQTLRLHSSSAINKLSNDRLEQTNIKRAFWSIYSMEKLYSLQEGLLPLIHGEYADHKISSTQKASDRGPDWLTNDMTAETAQFAVEEVTANKALPPPYVGWKTVS